MSAEDVRATDAELAEVLRLDGEATPGPWDAMRDGNQFVGERGDTLVRASRIEHLPRAWNPHANAAFGEVAHKHHLTRLKDEDADFIAAARALFPRMARELMALREEHRAADEALTRCGIEATSPRDTLADRIAGLVARAEEAERERDTAEADCVSYAGKLARLTKAKAECLEIAERATHQRDEAEQTRDALRKKARAVCEDAAPSDLPGEWVTRRALLDALRAEVDR